MAPIKDTGRWFPASRSFLRSAINEHWFPTAECSHPCQHCQNLHLPGSVVEVKCWLHYLANTCVSTCCRLTDPPKPNDSLTHQIRLAGPWDFYCSEDDATRCQLPFSNPEGLAVVTLRRRFHRPSNLCEHTRLFIVVIADGALDNVAVNDCDHLSDSVKSESTTFDQKNALRHVIACTDALQPFNELRITVRADQCSNVYASFLAIEEPSD